jgi:hypothetical protein
MSEATEAKANAEEEAEGEPDGTTSTVAQDRAREGIDHLQNAARELIAAARAALDVAEDLIDDPDAIASVVGSAGQFGGFGGLGDLLRNLLPTARPRGRHGDGEARDALAEDGGDGARSEPAIQRIEVV